MVSDYFVFKNWKNDRLVLYKDKSFSFTGSVLAESFSKGGRVSKSTMDAFIGCKNVDSAKNHKKNNLPLRIFLSTRTMVNFLHHIGH